MQLLGSSPLYGPHASVVVRARNFTCSRVTFGHWVRIMDMIPAALFISGELEFPVANVAAVILL